jgi:hypothetical protein
MAKDRSEYNAKYWLKHKDQLSAHRKQYYKENKEEIDARNKKWIEKNRERWNEYMRKRRKKAKLDKQKDV